jgi:hypothetical protein
MFKSKLINEGVQTSLYTSGGRTRVEGAPTGNHCRRAQVAVAIGRVHPLVGVRTRRTLTSGKGRGRVGEAWI